MNNTYKTNKTDWRRLGRSVLLVALLLAGTTAQGQTTPHATGVDGTTVYLNDLESHSWSYYSDSECPIHSLNPADITITYYGNGQTNNNMTTTDISNTPTSFGAKASGVQVGPSDAANTFVYYKTLERENADGTGDLPYTTIPNPFQVRPTGQSGTVTPPTRSITISGYGSRNDARGSVSYTYYDENNQQQSGSINISGTGISSNTIVAKTGTNISFTLTRTARTVYFNASYENGTSIASGNISNGSTNYGPYTIASTTITISEYRGFYAWRIKSLSSGLTISGKAVGDIVNAEETINFVTNNATGNAVEFEALWAQAYVQAGSTDLTTYANSYERNFHVVSSSTTASNFQKTYPCTVIGRNPNSTTNNATRTVTGGFTAAADTKFEDVVFGSATGSTYTGAGHNFTIGRGCSGTVDIVRGISANATNTFRFRVESGTYNNLYFMGNNGVTTGHMTAIMGCDYDRADGTNTNLKINTDILMSNGGTAGTTGTLGTERIHCTVKSGNYDLGSYGGNVQFYMSSPGQNNYAKRTLVIDGGNFSDVSGGMESNATSVGDHLMFELRIKGGTINGPTYGAAQNAAGGGHRKFIITGGNFKGWIAGGANGTNTTGGKLSGKTYIYFGGKASCNSNGSTTTFGPGNATGGNIFGAGSGNAGAGTNATVGEVDQSTVIIADECIVERNVYGGGNYGYVVGTGATNKSEMYILGGTVNGSVFGGSNMQKGNIVNYTIKGGTVKGGVYGGSNARGNLSGGVTMAISGGTMEGGVYGGGYGTNSVSCDVTGTVGITMTGGTVKTGLFGGGNVNSKIGGKATLNLNGGTVGVSAADSANVYGGGLGALTRMKGDVEVNIGGATIHGDVYGGSAKGITNCNDDGTARNSTAKTDVALSAGTVYGSIYGGGHGIDAAEAHVWGPVTVTVSGGSVKDPETGNPASVFGCNNAAGTPKNTVEVSVTGTDPTVITAGVKSYAINGVYGGGNEADYKPTTPSTYPTVTISGCTTSIKDVYGGGNAAAVPYTSVTVNGGDIDRVFGGGNGERGAEYPAHVGRYTASNTTYGSGTTNVAIHGGTINQVFGGSNSNGEIKGSINVGVSNNNSGCPIAVHSLYSGGNMAPSNLGILTIGCMNDGDMIDTLFCGANQANITGDVNFTMTGGRIGNLFGGNNKSGNVSGSITVTVNWNNSCSDNYLGNVFGGGNLATFGTDDNKKAPTVNILNGTVSGNVYGGGKGNLVDGNDRGTAGKVTGNPAVTIGDSDPNHTAIIEGDVYGGGDAADVAGTPVIVVNDCNTEIGYLYGGGNAADVNGTNITVNGGTIHHDAFGGGHGDKDASNPSKYADVKGNVVFNVYGGTIDRVFAGSNSKGTITGSSALTINKSSANGACDMIIREVYGGGNEAAGKAGAVTIGCTGTWTSNHDNANTTDNRIGYELEGIGSVYGGANQADIGASGNGNASNIALTINSGIVGNVFGGNNTSGTINGTITVNIEKDNNATCASNWYVGNVFGGGNQAVYTAPAGSQNYPAVNILNGTVSGDVFGGGKGDPNDHTKGQVTGNPVVTIGDASKLNDNTVQAVVTGDVYGGGDAGNVVGTPQVNIINKCNTSIANVYGGGNAADVSGTDVNIDGGTITGMVFGGGHGDKNANPQKQADVNGNVAVDITGGTINKVFGGSNSKGNITGTVAVNIAKGNNSCDMHITEVYGGGNEAAGNAGTLTIGCTGDYTTKSEGITNVYGGANAAAINNNINLTIRGGHIDNVFGGNNTSGTISGTIAVTVNWDNALTCDKYLGNVFGGGNLAAYTGSPTVTLTNGTVSHNIYGGGNEAGVGGSTVNINGGSVAEGVYGGCNTSGTVTGAIAVNLTNGTIGAQNGTTDIVFGGGYGDQTATQGNVTVTVNGSTIHGNVYGGSALGQVNNESTDLTTVDVLSGTVNGNIYGGGLGQAGAGNVTKGQVNGTVTVNIGAVDNSGATPVYSGNATINGSVYGCNNTNGSPKANVTVNVYQTAHTAKNLASYTQNDATYAIDQVFGGGNQADYNPTSTDSRATVHVYTCNNTIRRVFGGGNAAAAYGVVTTIDGGRFDYIFGGGNGESDPANIGAGGTNLTVNSGVINYLFGGSNEQGSINGTMGVTINNTGCTEQIKNFFAGGNLAVIGSQQNPVNLSTTIACGTVFDAVYGGSNLADIYGNVTLTINGGTIGEVFAGSKGRSATSDPNNSTPKAADIYGNTTLNIHAGAIGNAFGGSNINGNITGSITVNLDWNQSNCAQKSINNIFGASNLAAYTPTTPGAYPAVNIKHGTVSQNVFGGGKGDATDHTKGQVTSNPQVTIGDITAGHEAYVATVTGDVYGGGDAGNVVGTPVVTIPNKSNTSIGGDIYGGGNAADVNGTDVTIWGSQISGMVFGGGHGDKDASPQKQADVKGNVAVKVYGGTISQVFGGANSKGDITGSVAVTVNKSTADGAADMKIGEVYGGGNFAAGNAGSITIGCTGTWTSNHDNANTTDNRIGYELEGVGTVFGGANRANIGTAQNPSNITVNINSGIVNTVFGGNNNDGDIYGTITVNIAKNANACSWYVGNVYGGGFNADYTNAALNNPAVNVSAGKVTYNVYGGGKGTGAVVTGNPTVTLSGTAEVGGNVYGGGDAAAVSGNTSVKLQD